MNNKTLNIIVISLIFTLIILSIGYLFYINMNKQVELASALVKYKGSNYIIVTDSNKEYKLKINENINVGDILNLTIYNINYNKNPIEAEIKSINNINKAISYIIEDNNINTNYKEEDLIKYATTLNNNIDNNINIKELFINFIDFIFYDKELYGYKFSDISNETKLKLLSLLLKIDNKIDSKFPDYKEWIAENGDVIYNNIKNKALEKYLEITTNIYNNNDTLCDEAIKGFSDLKNNFSITWDNIKNIISDNKDKLKNYYEIWRRS